MLSLGLLSLRLCKCLSECSPVYYLVSLIILALVGLGVKGYCYFYSTLFSIAISSYTKPWQRIWHVLVKCTITFMLKILYPFWNIIIYYEKGMGKKTLTLIAQGEQLGQQPKFGTHIETTHKQVCTQSKAPLWPQGAL